MGGSKCCDKEGLKRGPWTAEEDQKLTTYIQQHGHGNWSALPEKAGLKRCGKSCRLRWINYLRPDIKRGKFSLKEEHTIIQLHALLGNRWSAIAAHLPKRTDNEIKNHWNTHLKKRLIKMGIDPITHKPRINALASPSTGHATTTNDATLSHMAQWERARLEAEARSSSSSSSSSLSLEYSNKQALQNQLGANILLPLTPTPKYLLDIVPKPWQVGAITGMSNYFANHDNIGLVQDVPTVEVNNSSLYACNELDGVVDGWKCLDHGFSQMAQGLEDGLDESTSMAAPLQGLSSTTTYSTENNAWTLVDCYGMESSSSDTLIGFPVSFSSMEVEKPNGSCNIADNGSYRVSDWDTTVKYMNDSSGSVIYRHPNPSSQT